MECIPFPESLRGTGFDAPMHPVEHGTATCVRWLLKNGV